MTFYEVVRQVLDLLQRQGRVSYRALKREFGIDDDYIEDLREELCFSHPVVDEGGRGLVWTGDTEDIPVTTSQPDKPEAQRTAQEKPPTQVEPPSTASHTPDAERRQLTVMFVDLVDSTRLSSELDPEDYREIVREYQRSCSEVITRFDGNVAQLLGDGLLVYFGYPIAHEDDAQRAVRAGLGIIDAIEILNTRLEPDKGVQLAVRLGIHTGLVVVGEMGGDGRQEQLALGETPNIAARIQGLAQPDTVVISAETYRLTEGFFECESLGEHDLRGVSQPIAVYHVLGDTGIQSRLDTVAPGGLTPLVGREREVGLLLDRWEQAKDGQGQVILLSGEAGIGKTRVVQVLKDHVSDESHIRWECRSSPYFTNSALYPVIDLIQRTLRWQPDDTPAQKMEKLTQNLRQYRLPLEETVPLFAALLSLPVSEDQYPPLNLSPQRQRQKTLEAIVAIMLELAEREPVLFILEDLHWGDPTTLELLNLLVDQIPTASVYALLTCRPEFQPTWSHRSYLAEMPLTRLSREQVGQIATQVAGGKVLPAEIVQQLVDKTDGVPLYVEEMTKSVLESGAMKDMDGRYELTGSIASLSIPATLQDSLMARLDRLITAKGVAQYASVIGRQFSFELLRVVSGLNEIMLQHELARLVEAELVYQRGLPPQAIYVFKHALIQDTAYESLLRSTRQGYHLRIAEVLEEQFPETAEHQPELLAHHYTEAGLNEQAVEYWQQAGERARLHAADVEAIAYFHTGLDVLTTLPATLERRRREIDLHILLALAYTASKGQAVPEVEHAYVKARKLLERVHDDYRLFRVLIGLYRCLGVRNEHQKREEAVEALVQVAQRLQDPHLLLEAHMVQANIMMYAGAYREARDHCEQALVNYDRYDHHAYIAESTIDPGVNVLSRLSWTLWCLGYPEQALVANREMLTLARELGHVHTLTMFSNFAALTHQLCGEAQSVDELTQHAMQLSTEHGFHQLHMSASIMQGWLLACHGRKESGLTQMQQGLTDYRQTGNALYQTWYLTLLADAYRQHQQSSAGLDTVAEAMAISRPFFEPELYRLKGELLLMQSRENQVEAEACFDHALDLSRRQQAKSWELRAATSLARLWQSQGKQDEARELLAPVYDWFTEGFDTADLIDAKTLLDELSSSIKR
jgi:predicted ATPase/class 3 adenylate cyclase